MFTNGQLLRKLVFIWDFSFISFTFWQNFACFKFAKITLFFRQHHSRPWQVPWVHWDGWGMCRCSGQCSGEEGGWLQEDQSLTLSPLLTYSFPEPFSHSGLMCSSGHGAVPGGEVSKVWLLPGCCRRMELGQGRALLPQGICKED